MKIIMRYMSTTQEIRRLPEEVGEYSDVSEDFEDTSEESFERRLDYQTVSCLRMFLCEEWSTGRLSFAKICLAPFSSFEGGRAEGG